MNTLHSRKFEWKPDRSPTTPECEGHETRDMSSTWALHMIHLEIWWQFRLQCRIFWSEAWDASFLSNKLHGRLPQRPHPACSFMWDSWLPANTAPGQLCLWPDLSLPGQQPWQHSLCLFLLFLPQTLSPFGSQLQTPRPLTYLWHLGFWLGLPLGVGWTYPFRF